ncbi:hypothetical protein Aph01nite_72630 [Acrocarpospora phusangensis]|uniref:Restriction endonuclease type IV Mrr domain-containing protein n=1 Tax=Acrocarpospora phusangensis TaxID=1070424 RepID=A0A919USR9_9ACTN|nr:restriction endonuclease [Acrocarpospora phusangensis]GIH28953.1 hypothetical protein Aph01nite_72630 [Acrocarpospora phusangensis]
MQALLRDRRRRRGAGLPRGLANSFAGHTGVLVTSGRLTRQARTEALDARQPLLLVERDRLADWLISPDPLLEFRGNNWNSVA